MGPVEEIYYGLGEICYAVTRGEKTNSSKKTEVFHKILEDEFKGQKAEFDAAEIIFQILERGEVAPKTAFQWGLHELKLHSQYLSDSLKQHVISIVNKMASAFQPAGAQAKSFIQNFCQEINSIHGDPVFSYITEDRNTH